MPKGVWALLILSRCARLRAESRQVYAQLRSVLIERHWRSAPPYACASACARLVACSRALHSRCRGSRRMHAQAPAHGSLPAQKTLRGSASESFLVFYSGSGSNSPRLKISLFSCSILASRSETSFAHSTNSLRMCSGASPSNL